MRLDRVVPWARSYDEYVSMFSLTEHDLSRRILGCGDGPAGFNAGLTGRRGRAVSVDPLYAFDAASIRTRIVETYDTVMTQMEDTRDDYVWSTISSIDELGRLRMAAMDNFLADYETGRSRGRYVAGEVPRLPFGDDAFELALSSHFLFLYSDHFSREFHLEALAEMLRVAREIRVFPLLTLAGTRSSHLDHIVRALADRGHDVGVRSVPYEFQRGGNEMLRVERM